MDRSKKTAALDGTAVVEWVLRRFAETGARPRHPTCGWLTPRPRRSQHKGRPNAIGTRLKIRAQRIVGITREPLRRFDCSPAT
jgi:hypothetical protein